MVLPKRELKKDIFRVTMTLHYNRRSERYKRKQLRNNPTSAERILWKYLKGKQVEECKFRRQHSIDQFIIDFYCAEVKLAIELDGSVHNSEEAKNYDKERENLIKVYGVTFLRFRNEEIYLNIESVILQITLKIDELRPYKLLF